MISSSFLFHLYLLAIPGAHATADSNGALTAGELEGLLAEPDPPTADDAEANRAEAFRTFIAHTRPAGWPEFNGAAALRRLADADKLLHRAAKAAAVDVMQVLLAAGASTSSPGDDESDDATWPDSPECRAARAEWGCPSFARWTPLHFATYQEYSCKRTQSMRLLLDHRADVNAHDAYDLSTPLHIAAAEGYVDAVRLLLQFGADPNPETSPGEDLECNMRSDHVWTPLLFAAANGHTEAAAALLEGGASIEWEDNVERTALFCATQYNHAETVAMLLERGANVEAKSVWGSVLTSAAAPGWGSTGWDQECVELLLSAGARVDGDGVCITALHKAAVLQGPEAGAIVAMLLQCNGSPSLVPSCCKEWCEVCNDTDHADPHYANLPPLHASVHRAKPFVLQMLARRDPNARAGQGLTPLHCLTKLAREPSKMWPKRLAYDRHSPSIQDKLEWLRPNTAGATVLLRAGADPALEDAAGQMPHETLAAVEEHASDLLNAWRATPENLNAPAPHTTRVIRELRDASRLLASAVAERTVSGALALARLQTKHAKLDTALRAHILDLVWGPGRWKQRVGRRVPAPRPSDSGSSARPASTADGAGAGGPAAKRQRTTQVPV